MKSGRLHSSWRSHTNSALIAFGLASHLDKDRTNAATIMAEPFLVSAICEFGKTKVFDRWEAV